MSTITSNQKKRIFSLLNETGETAWRDEYIGMVSFYTKSSTKELNETEAGNMIAVLLQVKSGNFKGFNPNNTAAEKKAQEDQANKLRRKILSICHQLGWYARDEKNILVLDEQDKPKLDFKRIDNFCQTYSKYKKKLNEHTLDELKGKGGLVFQFETIKTNTIYKSEKPWTSKKKSNKH